MPPGLHKMNPPQTSVYVSQKRDRSGQIDMRQSPAMNPLSLHDALPISPKPGSPGYEALTADAERADEAGSASAVRDRESTRLNSSHVAISDAVFCLEKKRADERLPVREKGQE